MSQGNVPFHPPMEFVVEGKQALRGLGTSTKVKKEPIPKVCSLKHSSNESAPLNMPMVRLAESGNDKQMAPSLQVKRLSMTTETDSKVKTSGGDGFSKSPIYRSTANITLRFDGNGPSREPVERALSSSMNVSAMVVPAHKPANSENQSVSLPYRESVDEKWSDRPAAPPAFTQVPTLTLSPTISVAPTQVHMLPVTVPNRPSKTPVAASPFRKSLPPAAAANFSPFAPAMPNSHLPVKSLLTVAASGSANVVLNASRTPTPQDGSNCCVKSVSPTIKSLGSVATTGSPTSGLHWVPSFNAQSVPINSPAETPGPPESSLQSESETPVPQSKDEKPIAKIPPRNSSLQIPLCSPVISLGPVIQANRPATVAFSRSPSPSKSSCPVVSSSVSIPRRSSLSSEDHNVSPEPKARHSNHPLSSPTEYSPQPNRVAHSRNSRSTATWLNPLARENSGQQKRRLPSRSSPVRVPSGDGVVNEADVEDSDEENLLKVSGQHIAARSRRGASAESPPPREANATRSGASSRACRQPRQDNTEVVIKQLSTNGSPCDPCKPTNMRGATSYGSVGSTPSSPTSKMRPSIIKLDLQTDSENEDPARNVSDATQRLLNRWQISAESLRAKTPTTVTLPLINGHLREPTRGIPSPSLPSFSAHTSNRTSSQTPKGLARSNQAKYSDVTSSIRLGPAQPTLYSSATPESDGRVSVVRDEALSNYQKRIDFGKNLERSWYQKMMEEEQKITAIKKLHKLVDVYNLNGTTDEFFRSFYSSCSDDDLEECESSDVSIDLGDEKEDNGPKAKSPFLRYASTDVLFSDQIDSSESDIDIVIQKEDLYDRRVKHKMRRKRKHREIKYQSLFGGEKEKKFQVQVNENGEEVFLPDTEIRALRLNLKKQSEEEVPFDESCTIEQLREQVMQALARINKNSKKTTKRRRKKHRDPETSRGYGAHKQDSLYERFLKEYGYLLQDYKIDPISDYDDSEEEMDQRGRYRQANNSGTLPPISMSARGTLRSVDDYSRRASEKHSLHLPQLNHTYQASPFSQSGMLIGDTYYVGGFSFDPRGKSSTKAGGVTNDGQLITPRKRKKQRLQAFLKDVVFDRLKLREKPETVSARVAPLSARRMSDPGVYNGKMLVKQKIIETESVVNPKSPVKNSPDKKKCKKSKKKNGKSKQRNVPEEPTAKNIERCLSSGSLPPYYGDEFVGCKQHRRTTSARNFHAKNDKVISLRELTKDYDFPSKEIRLQVAERRLRREKLRKDRVARRQEREALDNKFRGERRHLLAAAKTEYLRQLEIARANANREAKLLSEDEASEDSERLRWLEQLRKSMAKRQMCPSPDYKELMKTPIVRAGVEWGKREYTRRELTQEEIDDEVEDVSDLFLQMKDCRWIRWTKTQQKILDQVNQLELDLL